MEITNKPDKEFQVMVIKILMNVKKSGWFQSELQQRKNTELKKSKNEINTPEGIKSRSEHAEEQINNLEDRVMESNQGEQ